MNKIFYNKEIYNFASLIKEWFDWTDSLNLIHKQKSYNKIFERAEDQSTEWHKIYYKMVREDKRFDILYFNFIANFIKPRYNERVVFQTIPTFRVHLCDNIAVGEFHKDKNYRDNDWANEVKELNYYLPFTDTNEYNTFWVESVEDKGDYKPALINYGECLEWDGSNLTHGNKKNKSNYTRVSIDFRALPISRYKPSNTGSINTDTKFKIGGYYSII
jgi:hypothetical protein